MKGREERREKGERDEGGGSFASDPDLINYLWSEVCPRRHPVSQKTLVPQNPSNPFYLLKELF